MTRRHHQSGFSLVEVMVAILLLGIAVAGLTQGITTALMSNKESELQTAAALLAQGRIEELRATTGLEDGEEDGDCGPGLSLYRWHQTIAVADVSGLHEVTVAISHARTGETIYELKTLLFEPPTTSSPSSPAEKRRERNARNAPTS